jgi:DNA-binding transcriptional LysR family regulator
MSYFTFIRTFIAVYRCGSYNKASHQLGLTQPAISKQISSLEQQLNKKLFERNGRGMKPTIVADELASSLAYHVDSIEVIFNQSRMITDVVAGTIYIGGPKEFINAKMIPVFASLAQHDIKTILQINNPDTIYELMINGTLDLAITERLIKKPEIGYRILFGSELVLVSSPEWKEKLNGKSVLPEVFSEVPLLVYEEAFNYIQQFYIEVFGVASPNRPIITVEDLSIIHSLLCEGAGYSVLPRYLVEQDLSTGGLVELCFPQKPPKNTLYLTWNKFSMRNARTVLARDAIMEVAEKW